MLLRLFILPTKFRLYEIGQLENLITDAISAGADLEMAPEASQADIIVTKLVQPQRLERELRCLHLSRCVVVYKDSEYKQLLISHNVSNPASAWCIYSPSDSWTSHTATVLPHVSRAPKFLVAEPASASNYEHDITDYNNVDERATNVTKTESPVPAILLRRDSSADPSSQVYRKALLSANTGQKYACQRRTPSTSRNAELVNLFESLKLARILQGDHIGERAYSTAIASLKAYCSELVSATQIVGLEGCGKKFIAMTDEYLNTGAIREATDTWASEELNIMQSFWKCHGVGAVTAREWYHEKGYRDLNDAIQDWDQLSRPIQIGLKYYNDFLCTISREEVARIAHHVVVKAQQVASHFGSSSDVSHIVCGGYRRGKRESGDVDILLSHETCHTYEDMLMPLLQMLKNGSFVETTITSHTDEEQIEGIKFGTSTALVVIAMPSSIPGKQIRRRLDIIVCHPRSYATAILGWTGSTTLERDLRRYTSKMKGWKFESSGIRDESSGALITTEDTVWSPGVDLTLLEQNLFGLLDLDWIPPEFRCA